MLAQCVGYITYSSAVGQCMDYYTNLTSSAYWPKFDHHAAQLVASLPALQLHILDDIPVVAHIVCEARCYTHVAAGDQLHSDKAEVLTMATRR